MIRTISNIIWFIFGGIFIALAWFILGLILCITVAGIPLGLQCFKAARLSFFPYGKTVKTNYSKHRIANTVWGIFIGWWLALIYLIFAILNFITVVGISRGLYCVKLMNLAFCPFGAEVIDPYKKKKKRKRK